jgi:hypothetical protein
MSTKITQTAGWSRHTRPGKLLPSSGGATPGLISCCAEANLSGPTAASCSRYGQLAGTGTSPARCSKTSQHFAIGAGGAHLMT